MHSHAHWTLIFRYNNFLTSRPVYSFGEGVRVAVSVMFIADDDV